jgi:hypothetical protein
VWLRRERGCFAQASAPKASCSWTGVVGCCSDQRTASSSGIHE